MSKKMLIDATHSEETRVAVIDGARLEELDVTTSTKKQLKGNIYLAKVMRVEPSLQAAFVEYGGNRHGFLAFNEIHPDYYQIPVADREALKKELQDLRQKELEAANNSDEATEEAEDAAIETVSGADLEDLSHHRHALLRKYKIQEVIHHNQVLLVQVTKEERGNKGAALTTYLSLAGRYSVLMPNNATGGGVSRKISNAQDRKRLKTIVESLPIPEGMSIIIRTAGKEQSKPDIKRDYDYLIKTWVQIRDKTLKSNAPCLIHEESNLIKRTLRDSYTNDIEEIWVEGAEAFKMTKAFMKMLMPQKLKQLKEYKKPTPLFQAYNIEGQIEELHDPNVSLRSGGYLVINQTEALVAIDVNSGRATRERNIEETAIKTNLEAADEVARQMRLRDLAGLVVVDFIDMEEMHNNHLLERRMKEALKRDRARVQMSRISGFGLMEISRQRLHPSFLETSHHVCPYCHGKGVVRSVESNAVHILYVLAEAAEKHPQMNVTITVPTDVAMYILNTKRANLLQMEEQYKASLKVLGDDHMLSATDFRLEFQSTKAGASALPTEVVPVEKVKPFAKKLEPVETVEEAEKTAPQNEPAPRRGRHRGRRKGNQEGKNVATETAGEEKFKVVHQEPLILYDSHKKAETTAAPTPIALETPVAPEKKKRGRPAKAKPAPTAEEPELIPAKPKKGGWWNKLVG